MTCPLPNENLLDRLIRALTSFIISIVAFFWLWGFWMWLAYGVAAILMLTAFAGFCGMYRLFGWDTTQASNQPKAKVVIPAFLVIFVVVGIAGSYASLFFTRKFFLEDYNRMNNSYKQTLFTTGQGQREASMENYRELVNEYAAFQAKYSAYRPFALRTDQKLSADLEDVQSIIEGLQDEISEGDLQQAHLSLEEIRPIFQDMLKRNNFSLLAVYLVDFHDAMEKVLDAADAKDPSGVIQAYQEADMKLKDVESVANDTEIQAIRSKLDEVRALADQDNKEALPDKGAELKSSFVKVYLVRG